jgi:hypothetical protein
MSIFLLHQQSVVKSIQKLLIFPNIFYIKLQFFLIILKSIPTLILKLYISMEILPFNVDESVPFHAKQIPILHLFKILML